MKGISPMIATVLLIAFTVGVGGILSVWLSSLTTTSTTTTSSGTETQFKCASSVLKVNEVRFSCGDEGVNSGATRVNITVTNEAGTEVLRNLTYEVTGGGITNRTGTVNNVSAGQSLGTSLYQGNTTQLGPGCPYEIIRVRAYCQDKISVIGDCKSGQSCYKRT